jgi:hypothetical protein
MWNKVFLLIIYCLFALGCDKNSSSKKEVAEDEHPTSITSNEDNNVLSIAEIGSMCSYEAVEQNGNVYILSENTKVNLLIDQITHFIGAPTNFEVRAATVGNALAIIPEKGKYKDMRMILYNPKFFLDVEENTKTDWATVSILCHEIGHHMLWHTHSKANTFRTELDADKYSGWLMRNLGASKAQSIRAMDKIGSSTDSETHPRKDVRIASILAGWEEADFNITEGSRIFASRMADDRPDQITIQALVTTLEQQTPPPRDILPDPIPSLVPINVQTPPPALPRTLVVKSMQTALHPNDKSSLSIVSKKANNEKAKSSINSIKVAQSVADKPIFVIPLKYVSTEIEAKTLNANYLAEGIRADFIETSKYNTLNKMGGYLVFIGPFQSQYSCEIAVENYKKKHPATYGILLNSTSEQILVRGLGDVLYKKK